MDSLNKLTYLLEPSSLALITTAISTTYFSALRSLSHGRELARNLDFSESSITLDKSQALLIPLFSSISLLIMFYLFSSVSQLVTFFIALASGSALFFSLSPLVSSLKSKLSLPDPFVSNRCCSKPFTRLQLLTLIFCILTVLTWLITGNWLLNNILGISICITFVSHVRLPNIKISFLLLFCLFLYDIFWVFFSEYFFGANVMVSVATQKASNPIHYVADSFSLPGLEFVTKKLEMPVKLVFPRDLVGGVVNRGVREREYMMLGLGDMAIPAMLLALVLSFDHRKDKDVENNYPSKNKKYIFFALAGYSIGLISALAAGILSQSPQPALLYLVPSTLGPVIFVGWLRNEVRELWEGSRPLLNDKAHLLEV
ncbi:hypothetical protein LUZ60_012133 [Juncus effusus]|nr:hypothetical protein LUZ60_012133 [Juncus effusus]